MPDVLDADTLATGGLVRSELGIGVSPDGIPMDPEGVPIGTGSGTGEPVARPDGVIIGVGIGTGEPDARYEGALPHGEHGGMMQSS